jgi:hypothetical protein
MAKVKLLFYGTEETNTENITLECFYNSANEVSIMTNDNDTSNQLIISFDKETAIRFSRELRKQIALMD